MSTSANDKKPAKTRQYICESMAKQIILEMKRGPDNADELNDVDVATVQSVTNAFVSLVVRRTVDGETTTINNFATFSRKLCRQRTRQNPQNNAPIVVPEHYKLMVDTKPAFKEKLRKSKTSDAELDMSEYKITEMKAYDDDEFS